jgi:restriction system protein
MEVCFMPVPDYQTLMAPALQALRDGKPRTVAAVREDVAERLGISADDRREMIKSGSPVFDSRVHWALTYMGQACLLRRPKRGVVQVTDRGRHVLERHPDRIDNHVLAEFPEFREFKSRVRRVDTAPAAREVESSTALAAEFSDADRATPRETVDAAVQEVNEAVAAELLSRIRDQDPSFLERLVLRLLTAMGYGGAAGSAEQLGRSGDEGLDGVIRQDSLGLDQIYVQAKRYAADRPVGRPDIQGFVGALHGAQANRGVFITTSRFSQDAYVYAEKVAARIILIDGSTLAGLCVNHNIGVQDREVYVLKRIDEDFFDET